MLCWVAVSACLTVCCSGISRTDSPDQTAPADWTKPYWRHDPTSGRWTDPLPCDQPGRKEPPISLENKFTPPQWQMRRNAAKKQIALTPPLSHFTLTLMASGKPFSPRPSPLPEERGPDEAVNLRLTHWGGRTEDMTASYRIPIRDAGAAALQTSSRDFSLVRLLPSVKKFSL